MIELCNMSMCWAVEGSLVILEISSMEASELNGKLYIRSSDSVTHSYDLWGTDWLSELQHILKESNIESFSELAGYAKAFSVYAEVIMNFE